MRQYICNPMNLPYKYQFIQTRQGFTLSREAADPSLVLFHDKYYLFPSMTKGFFVSEDLVEWTLHKLEEVPVYDYAPDVRVVGDYLYFSASKRGENCDFYRTKDPESGKFEKIEGTFDFWDPNLFVDDDGRIYIYWGCSNVTPIYGVELEPETMKPIGEKVVMIDNHKTEFGFERTGENHVYDQKTNGMFNMIREMLAQMAGISPEEMTDIEPYVGMLPEEKQVTLRKVLSGNPCVEGAWMTKYKGKYYLQYAVPGTQYNVYGDGVYVGDSPLGRFAAAENNPFSYMPGGFCPGAGHGSTLLDKKNRWWHISTSRISVNENFERRLGFWPAGFDKDGELFCNQRYGDWPVTMEEDSREPWKEPEWMLLSYGKRTAASSEEKPAAYAVDENIQTWWKAKTNEPGEWIQIDLGENSRVHAIQVNFADDFGIVESLPQGRSLVHKADNARYIEDAALYTRWLLSGSVDGENWFVIEDKRNAQTDLPHDLIVREQGVQMRYVRLTVQELPYQAKPCVSGLRIFGRKDGNAPQITENVSAKRTGDMEMLVTWKGDAVGYEVLWGTKPERLYHSYRVFKKNEQEIRALMKDVDNYYVRVDAFNECGITHGEIVRVDMLK